MAFRHGCFSVRSAAKVTLLHVPLDTYLSCPTTLGLGTLPHQECPVEVTRGVLSGRRPTSSGLHGRLVLPGTPGLDSLTTGERAQLSVLGRGVRHT